MTVLVSLAALSSCDDSIQKGEACGDGRLEPDEICDPGIPTGEPGACPISCSGGDVCNASRLTGSASDCTASCTPAESKACGPDDGCCPADCDGSSDPDCRKSCTGDACQEFCGDGIVNGQELCDGDCPLFCEDSPDACTVVFATGDAATCDAECTAVQITTCVSGDGCCPPGCDDDDRDCCGNRTCGELYYCEPATGDCECDPTLSDCCVENGCEQGVTRCEPTTEMCVCDSSFQRCCGPGSCPSPESCNLETRICEPLDISTICAKFCDVVSQNCQGENRAFLSRAACRDECPSFRDSGEACVHDLSTCPHSGDSVQCRAFHADRARTNDPGFDCNAAAGGEPCGD